MSTILPWLTQTSLAYLQGLLVALPPASLLYSYLIHISGLSYRLEGWRLFRAIADYSIGLFITLMIIGIVCMPAGWLFHFVAGRLGLQSWYAYAMLSLPLSLAFTFFAAVDRFPSVSHWYHSIPAFFTPPLIALTMWYILIHRNAA